MTKKLSRRQVERKKIRDRNEFRISSKLIDFFLLITDLSPQYCFLCGYYIPTRLRETEVKKPFKNGDFIHEDCFNRIMKVKHLKERLNPESELICHIDLGWGVQPIPVCRDRVKNTQVDIQNHCKKHGFDHIQEGFDWKQQRNQFFLKPNGKPFARVSY